MKRLIFASLFGLVFAANAYSQTAPNAPPEYSIEAIRYAMFPQFPVSALVMGAPKDEKLDIAMVFWLVRGGGRTILVDSGFHRAKWLKLFPMKDYLPPDEAVAQAGVKPEDVTDIIITHGHWDHMGGIDLFPRANIWIQRQEFQYYVDEAFRHMAVDPGPATIRSGPTLWCRRAATRRLSSCTAISRVSRTRSATVTARAARAATVDTRSKS